MTKQLIVLAACAALLGMGCGSDPDPVADSGPPQPDSGPTPMVDSGPMSTGEGFGRQRAAFDRLDAAICACNFAEAGFASAAECTSFGELAEQDACEDQAFAASAGAANAAFDCLAPVVEQYATCVEGAGCDDAAVEACGTSAQSAAMGCPEAPAAYTNPLASCFSMNIIGTEASTCPENTPASSELGDSVFSGSTVGAGADHEGSCEGAGAPDRVFEWTAPSAGTFEIDTAGSAYDTVLYVLEACAGAEIDCNDDADAADIGLRSRVTVTLTAGQTIFIVVDGYDVSAGTFQVNIAEGEAPADGGVPMTDGGATDADAGVPMMDGGAG